jgi:GNAT superfamily N-acetyltransferase
VRGLRLRPMTEEEFRGYERLAIAAFAADLVRNVKLSPEAATSHAARTFGDALPDGLATRDHWVYVAENEAGRRVGVLWFARKTASAGDIVWLYDVEVDQDVRGQGYGRRLMERLEEEVAALGIGRIELNVFGHNAVALGLYEDLGYVEMSRQMFKELHAS